MHLPSRKEREAMTPMMRQYYELKEQSPAAIMFFRMGDFYEIFGHDAEEVAPKLNLVLTSRERGDQERIPFCGVPHHSAKGYWIKLLKAGYKVAIADQVEDPALTKGLVRREIIKVMTPGCIDDLEGLESEAPNYLFALYEIPEKQLWSCVLVDVSTGEFRLGAAQNFDEVLQFIKRYQPREILCRRFFINTLQEELQDVTGRQEALIEALPEGPLRDRDEQKLLIDLAFRVKSIKDLPCGITEGGDALTAATLSYIKSLQIGLGHFLTIRPLNEPSRMTLDETVIRDLELFETTRRRELKGSLFAEINRAQSAMGARFLRYSLGHPLLNKQEIQHRREAVRNLKNFDGETYAKLRDLLKVTDVDRLVTKLMNRSLHPAELGAIAKALRNADLIIDILSAHVENPNDLLGTIAADLEKYMKVLQLIDPAVIEDPGSLGQGNLVFKSGFDSELDALNAFSQNGASELKNYEDSLRKETGITSLKIKSHKTFGLLIEVTKANLAKVPSSFIRRQTMVNCERFVTEELKELDEKLQSGFEKAVALEAKLYSELLERICEVKEEIKDVARGFAMLDMLQSFAYLAREEGYICPKFAKAGEIKLRGAKHPVVYRFVGEHKYNPNNLDVDSDRRHVLITGPNMAGKSTIMRQVAITAILNQMGCFVPSQEAILPLFDRIFTRVGASDDLAKGQSTFMVEMTEAAHILREATDRSLVILDEVGRGTSTQDGLSLASAILEDLVTRVNCYSMFATHYHELVPFARKLRKVACIQPEVLCEDEQITFTHNIVEGASGHSFGLEVAKLAGVPHQVIKRAREVLDEQPQINMVGERPVKAPPVLPEMPPLEQKFMISEISENRLREISDKILSIRIHRTTPLQALNLLNDLRNMADNKTQGNLFGH